MLFTGKVGALRPRTILKGTDGQPMNADEIQGMLVGPVYGVSIRATERFFHPNGQWLENENIHELIHGPHWRKLMQQSGMDPNYQKAKHGFCCRYWTHIPGTNLRKEETNAADLMEGAARKALEKSGLSPDEISLVISVSTTSPRYTSSLGTILCGRLGIRAPAFEMKSGCSSAIYALITAFQFLNSGMANNVLIMAGETLSKVLDPEGPLIYAAGDGGAAIILGRSNAAESGLISGFMDSDGSLSGAMGVPGLLPPMREELEAKRYYLEQTSQLGSQVLDYWTRSPAALYKHSGLTGDDVDLYIPHQVSKEILDFTQENAGISADRMIRCIERYGNCGSATVLIALSEAMESSRMKHGVLMLHAVGGGLAWAGVLIRI